MRERCHNCDRPKATREDFDRDDREGDDGLCWGGMCPQVDWRARALAAEERLAMIQEGDRVDVLGGGKVVAVYGPASKRMASVKTDRGDYVEVECAKCTVLQPAFKIGDWVTVLRGGNKGSFGRIERIDHEGWAECYFLVRSPSGHTFGTLNRDCAPASYAADPLTRFAALISDAETCALDGAATEQAKCIAAMAKVLRESQTQIDEAKRTLRAIVELVR